MATIIEAYEALKAGKRAFWQDTEAVLSFNTRIMIWKDAELQVHVTEALLIDWKIKESKPEPELGYVDCPVRELISGDYVFELQGSYRMLDQAPRCNLIGYVYDDEKVRSTPTVCFGNGLYKRCVAVRIEKEK